MKALKNISIIVFSLGLFLFLFINNSVCFHEWDEATCFAPSTCKKCGLTEGELIAHEWIGATCTSAEICSICGQTQGEKLEHDLDEIGWCKLCGNNIGLDLTLDNYSQYINIEICNPNDSSKPPEAIVDSKRTMYYGSCDIELYLFGVKVSSKSDAFKISDVSLAVQPVLKLPGLGTFEAKALYEDDEPYDTVSFTNLSDGSVCNIDSDAYFPFNFKGGQEGNEMIDFIKSNLNFDFDVRNVSGIVQIEK